VAAAVDSVAAVAVAESAIAGKWLILIEGEGVASFHGILFFVCFTDTKKLAMA
jgi:hypothetical protein